MKLFFWCWNCKMKFSSNWKKNPRKFPQNWVYTNKQTFSFCIDRHFIFYNFFCKTNSFRVIEFWTVLGHSGPLCNGKIYSGLSLANFFLLRLIISQTLLLCSSLSHVRVRGELAFCMLLTILFLVLIKSLLYTFSTITK